ncbi:class I SAM-dependent methyltransferase [Alicyclobacillus fodiniaquatilis]|uniref:Class I SAM-dependent methyltransferase n=1 Tax=Alicyclobacillus fodiniaquatilis TaxID=1661150 RepID=A0ABW4JQU4_9BACL
MDNLSNQEVKRLVQQHWDGRAIAFDDKAHHGLHSEDQHRAWLVVLNDLAGEGKRRVLDVGCGTGFLALMFAELGHDVTGVDMSTQMLQQAKQKAQQRDLLVEFRLGDAEMLAGEDNLYDLIIERHLIWTLPSPSKAVSAWMRALKTGGRLALIEGEWGKNKNGAYQEIHTHLPFFGGKSSETLEAFLLEKGLTDVCVQSLMEPVLWGEVPQHPRYMIVGRREA